MLPSEQALTLCQPAARQLIENSNWRLLPEEEFAARAARVMAEQPALSPHQACQHVYALELHDACCDSQRRERAYSELHLYLYRIALHRRPELAEDAAQQAILLIFQQIDRCVKPGAFLHFAYLKLLQAIKSLARSKEPPLEPKEPGEEFEEPWERLPKLWVDELPPDDARIDDLWECIRRVWQTRPRARDQLRVVLWTYFGDLFDEEICQLLGKFQEQVYVLRSRGLDKLRRCMAAKGYSI